MFDKFVQVLKTVWQVLTFSAFKIGEENISLLLIIEVLALLVIGFVFAKQLRKVLKARLAKTRLDEGAG